MALRASSRGVLGVVVAAVTLASCSDPLPGFNTRVVAKAKPASAPPAATVVNEDCPMGDDWFPATAPVRMFVPLPHPDTECPFYRGAYQNYLLATQPDAKGSPAILRYATIDDAFQSATPHAVRNTSGRAWLGAIRQAGRRQVLIDQNGHTLYYGIHMNQAFVDFIKANNLQTVAGIQNVDPNLPFPPGLVEFKSAWVDIDPGDFPGGKVPPPTNDPNAASDPGDYSNYITTMAWVPHLSQNPSTGTIVEDPNHPRLIKVALVAIHSVYTLPGHPEFIWGSVQHVNLQGNDAVASAAQGVPIVGAPDCQPDTTQLPDLATDPDNNTVSTPVSPYSYLLYKGGTPENRSNAAYADNQLQLDEASQSFQNAPTSVYRMFPGSKSQQITPDTAIVSLNANLTAFAAKQAQGGGKLDPRLNYHLVAAVWLDKPSFFKVNQAFQNDATNPLYQAAAAGDAQPQVSQGSTCGTPLGPNGGSGDVSPSNTVPGCVTRKDILGGAQGDAGMTPGQLVMNDFLANGTDSPFSLLGGEDRLSSTSMETFTQAPDAFPNCFSCHNTQPITTNGTPQSRDPTSQLTITKPALINVSHLFSEFVLRESAGQ